VLEPVEILVFEVASLLEEGLSILIFLEGSRKFSESWLNLFDF
jgi:hypothetical protein